MAVADSGRLQLMVATLTYTGIKQLGAPPYKCPGEGVNSVCCLIGVISASSAEANDPNEIHTHGGGDGAVRSSTDGSEVTLEW